jgi:DNA topoisomerase-1
LDGEGTMSKFEKSIKADGANCGTGAGGFKPGNRCGRGAGGMVDTKRNPDGKLVLENGKPLPPHIPTIPPAWTDVTVAMNPKADRWVRGFDGKRCQSLYSDEHWTNAAKRKFVSVSELMKKERSVVNEIHKHIGTDKHEEASVMKLIHHTGIRPGSNDDTGAKVKAYGATTLEGRHVVKDGNTVRLQYIGKKGVALDIHVTDPEICKDLLHRKSQAGADGKLFGTSEGKVLDFVHGLDGGGFKTKDFRTLVGTKTALREAAKMPKPTTKKEYIKQVNAVADLVAAKLGNTRTVALQSYIDPAVFAEWRGDW